MQEGLAFELGRELPQDALEHLLQGGGVAHEGDNLLEALRGEGAHGRLDVIGGLLHELARVLVLQVEHVLVDFLGGHASAKQGAGGQLAVVVGIGEAHHVLCVEYFLGQFDHGQGMLIQGAAGVEGNVVHDKVQPGDGDQIDFTYISLIRKEKA